MSSLQLWPEIQVINQEVTSFMVSYNPISSPIYNLVGGLEHFL